MNARENMNKSPNQAVDAMLENLLKVFPSTKTSEDMQQVCDAAKKIMPYVDSKYVSYKLAKMTTERKQKMNLIIGSGTVQDYVQSLLQQNNGDQRKSDFNSVNNSLANHGKSGGDFNLNSLSNALNGLQKKEPYKEEVSSPNMVIHVCDEAKNLKQDFDCPRDLLIQEMRYFAEYLSVDSQRLEEVDISVHCDIHIFDWLMRYVKRGTKLIEESDIPKLDPNNVISILISSDFLKMNSLVEACISYCHKHMSSIVATPCNMNCVNEKLTTLIAEKFTHAELEDVKDRKDKFKSKLFCKKIEKLFDSSMTNPDSPGKASSLFKCIVCQRLLTWELNTKLPCTNNHLSVSSKGGLSYDHEPDSSWDINSYLISLYEELHKWNLVYWRLWGIVNHLDCSRCGQTFQVCDFGKCMHHPERPQYTLLSAGDTAESPVGVYPCCNQQVLRFDPTGLNNGCHAKDHSVTSLTAKQQRVLDDFMAHKSLIKSALHVCYSPSDLNIFALEETRCCIKDATMTPVEISSLYSAVPAISAGPVAKRSIKKFSVSSENDEEDVTEDEISPLRKSSTQLSLNLSIYSHNNFTPAVSGSSISLGNETTRSYVGTKKKEKIQVPSDSTSYKKYPSKQRWDSARSIRFNQDIQREEDRRRMTSITSNLAKQRTSEKVEKVKTKDPKELPGGIFMKLEMSFFNNLKNQGSGGQFQTLSRQYGGKDFKSKARR